MDMKMLVVTGRTDNYGMRKLNDILRQFFCTVEVQRALGILMTSAKVPAFYQVMLDGRSRLTLVRPDEYADHWKFEIMMALDSETLAGRIRRAFTGPGVSVYLRNVQVTVPGTPDMTAVKAVVGVLAEKKTEPQLRELLSLHDLDPVIQQACAEVIAASTDLSDDLRAMAQRIAEAPVPSIQI